MGKKPKLSPEEKKQLKLEKKLAKKLAAEEVKKQVKRDFLSRELKYGAENTKKLDQKWKEILHNAKLSDLSFDFNLAVVSTERLVDAKDFQISLLLDELEDSDKQYEMNFTGHCKSIDTMLRVYLDQIYDLKTKFETEVTNLIVQKAEEIDELIKYNKTEGEYLSALVYGDQKKTKTREYETTVNRLRYIEEMRHKYIENQNLMAAGLEKRFINTWNAYKTVLQQYQDDSCEKGKVYDELAAHNFSHSEVIKWNRSQLFIQYVNLKKEKDKQEQEQDKYQQKLHFFNEELRMFKQLLQNIKNKLDIDELTDTNQLTFLVQQITKSQQKLDQKIKEGEKLLKLAAISRKYETEEEKILPFPKLFPEQILKKGIKSNRMEIDGSTKELINFWNKVAKIDVCRNFLNEELEILLLENKELRRAIIDYLHGDPRRVTKIAGIKMKILCK